MKGTLDLDILTDLVEVSIKLWLLLFDEGLYLFECQFISHPTIHLQFWPVPQLLAEDHILDILLEDDGSVLFPWETFESQVIKCKTELIEGQEMRLSVGFLEDEVRGHTIHRVSVQVMLLHKGVELLTLESSNLQWIHDA